MANEVVGSDYEGRQFWVVDGEPKMVAAVVASEDPNIIPADRGRFPLLLLLLWQRLPQLRGKGAAFVTPTKEARRFALSGELVLK